VGTKEFPNLIYNGKFCGSSPRCGRPAACLGPRWTVGGADTRRGGALPARGARALGLTRAHWRWPRGMRATRLCWRGAHRSTSDGEEVARQRWSVAVEASHHANARVEGRTQMQGGEVR
jgi:hypothetical protein